MRQQIPFLLTIFLLTAGLTGCREQYIPPVTNAGSGYLVVDGMIVNGADSSVITLTRSRPISDSSRIIYENSAQVSLVSATGSEVYPFTWLGNGRYGTDQLLLNTNESYQLQIATGDGAAYSSDTVPVRTSPPIKSVSWRQDSTGVRFYLNTEDPAGNTVYYRWEYVETWKYYTGIRSFLDYNGGSPVFRDLNNQIYFCYLTRPSTDINVSSSEKLSSDVITGQVVDYIPAGSEKLGADYSTLIKQFALTREAYGFWNHLETTSQQLGSLFDPQPSTQLGNIHCTSNPSLTAVGYVSISSLQQLRLFLSKNDVFQWDYLPYYGECKTSMIMPENLNSLFPSASQPYLFTLIGSNNGNYLYTDVGCGDCRTHGGTTEKPSFMP